MQQSQTKVDHLIEEARARYLACAPAFRTNVFRKLKGELSGILDELFMSEDRKSYLLHQLNNVHSMDDLFSLVKEINQNQFQETHFIDVLYPIISAGRIQWGLLKYSGNLLH